MIQNQQQSDKNTSDISNNLGQIIVENLLNRNKPKSDLPPEIQEMLNRPIEMPSDNLTDISIKKDKEFLNLIKQYIAEGKIDLYKPSSLINKELYDKLSPDQKFKIEQDSFNLLSKIREIWRLTQNGYENTYQLFYLLHYIRITKEQLENFDGDIFII